MKKNNEKLYFEEFYKFHQNFSHTCQNIAEVQTEIAQKLLSNVFDQSLTFTQNLKKNEISSTSSTPIKSNNKKQNFSLALGLTMGLLNMFNISTVFAGALTKQMLFPLTKKEIPFQKTKNKSTKLRKSYRKNLLNKKMRSVQKKHKDTSSVEYVYDLPSPKKFNNDSGFIETKSSFSQVMLEPDNKINHNFPDFKEELSLLDKKNNDPKDLRLNQTNEGDIDYKPNIGTHYLDMLKELKDKFKETKDVTFADQKKDIQDLNQISDQLQHTSTGAFFKHTFKGKKDSEKALSATVQMMLNKILKDEKSSNKIVHDPLLHSLKTDFNGMQEEITNLCRDVLINSTVYGEDYYTFYHGHNNDLRLYIDLLREIKSYEVIQNLEATNPLRDKGLESENNTVKDILDQYEDKALDYAACNGTDLYDLKRGMGVGFAPDKIEFFRDNVISTNINLFGNMNTLAECTLFYWLDSFNISNPNEALIKNIFKRLMPNVSNDILNSHIKKYTDLYNEFMKETGGNLMQIHVHKSVVDEICFASWMKGIPVLLNKESETLATRGTNNKPVPVLTDKEGKYLRPSASSYIDLYTKNPDEFIKKYSDFSSKDKISTKDLINTYDRPQMRLIINPHYFTNPDLVKVTQFTRFKSSEEAVNKYQSSLKNFIKEDIKVFLEDMNQGYNEGQAGNPLTKLNQYIREGTEFVEQNEGRKSVKKTPDDIEEN